MSLILEALRKSEAERRRDSAPHVALELPPTPARTARQTPRWVWPALLAGIGMLIAFIGWPLSRPDAPSPAQQPPTARSGDAPPLAEMATPRIQATPAVRMTDPPTAAPPIAPPVQTETATASAPPVTTPAAPAPIATESRTLPPPPPVAAPAAHKDTLPPLTATGGTPVKLSMHMWNEDPSRRFVILDGQRMAEGDRSGDLTVIAIERDGVVVERNGQRAKIPLR